MHTTTEFQKAALRSSYPKARWGKYMPHQGKREKERRIRNGDRYNILNVSKKEQINNV